ncbi:MAG: hypothetical protein U9N45_00515, partial [Gemmatimonadota bacterium]|nr:hypothetical protein [Gemmatimonadota bacterium]
MGIIPLLPRLLYLASFILLLTAGCGRREKAPPPPENEAAQEEKPSGWQVLGPGGGGAQYWPTINPADPDHIFICCDMTGVFVTENGGESWRMFNLHGAVKDFEFDPQNPNTVYAADNGLYRSDDRGKVWRLIYPEPATVVAQRMLGDEADHHFETAGGVRNIIIDKVRVDPVNNSRVYSGFHEKGNPMASLLVSNDRGESWKLLANSKGSKVLAIFPGSWNGKPDEVTLVTDQSMARVTESTGDIVPQQMPCAKVYFADGGKGAQGGVFYLMASMEAKDGKVSGGVFRTDDGGKSWKQINKGLLDGWAVTGKLPLFKSFGVCEQYPRVVYLSAYSYYARFNGDVQRQFGILKTENSGNSWHWCYRANDDSVLTNNFYGAWLDRNYEQAPGRREYPLCLGVSPVHPDICYATDMGRTYRSLDGGKRWDQVYSNDHPDGSSSSRGIDVTTCYGVHFDPFDKNHIFISYTDIGAFHSFNGGRSWYQAITGIPHHWRNTCYWLEFDPAVKGRIWAAWSNTHDLPRSKMYRSGALAGGRQQGGVSVSTDGGRQWELCSGGMLENGQYKG